MVLDTLEQPGINVKNIAVEQLPSKSEVPFDYKKDIPNFPFLINKDWEEISGTFQKFQNESDLNNDQSYTARKSIRFLTSLLLIDRKRFEELDISPTFLINIQKSRRMTVAGSVSTAVDSEYIAELLPGLKKITNTNAIYSGSPERIVSSFKSMIIGHEYQRAIQRAIEYRLLNPNENFEQNLGIDEETIKSLSGTKDDGGWFTSYLKILYPKLEIDEFEKNGQLSIALHQQLTSSYENKDWSRFLECAKILSIMYADDIKITSDGIKLFKSDPDFSGSNVREMPLDRSF